MVKCWQILEFEIYYLVLHIEAHVYLVIKFAKGIFVGPLQRVRPRNGILGLVVVVVLLLLPLRSEFIGEL